MAKKSVLIYADMLDVIDEMNDQEAAEIIRAIKAYLNGEEYTFESRIAKLSFMPMMSYFERDAQKYESIVQKRTDAINKRWQKYRENKAEEVQQPEEPPIAFVEEPVLPKTKPKSAHHADYDWIDPAFHDIFKEFLEYKRREKKGTYKTEATLKKAYETLIEYSNNDPNTAAQIVNQTIANGYMGLVPIKNNNRNGSSTNYERHIESQQQLGNDLAEFYRIKQEQERAAAEGSGTGGFVPPSLLHR